MLYYLLKPTKVRNPKTHVFFAPKSLRGPPPSHERQAAYPPCVGPHKPRDLGRGLFHLRLNPAPDFNTNQNNESAAIHRRMQNSYSGSIRLLFDEANCCLNTSVASGVVADMPPRDGRVKVCSCHASNVSGTANIV
jgi:hypothetical protein